MCEWPPLAARMPYSTITQSLEACPATAVQELDQLARSPNNRCDHHQDNNQSRAHSACQLKRSAKKHAGEDMSDSPSQCRQHVHDIKLSCRHACHAGYYRNDSPHWPQEAAEKHALAAMFFEIKMSTLEQFRVLPHWPKSADSFMKMMPKPITDPVAHD